MQLDQDWQGFIRSIATYTRIPVKVDWSSTKEYTPSVCFLPLIGALVGVLSAWPLVLTNWSVEFQALMMMLTAVLITGAFHEDGLMDACDGLLGGWTPEQRLSIMKDSRIGSYGLMAGLFAFTIKWWLLTQWVIYGAWYSDVTVTLYGWIAMHISARWLPLGIMSCLHYVTLGDSKAQAMISPFTTRGVLWVILSFALVAVLIGSVALISVGLMLLLSLGLLVAYLSFKIRGYNGDTLGASEQIAEIVILFTLLGWKA